MLLSRRKVLKARIKLIMLIGFALFVCFFLLTLNVEKKNHTFADIIDLLLWFGEREIWLTEGNMKETVGLD